MDNKLLTALIQLENILPKLIDDTHLGEFNDIIKFLGRYILNFKLLPINKIDLSLDILNNPLNSSYNIKLINNYTYNKTDEIELYEYPHSLDVIVYNKITKIRNNIIILMYQNDFKGTAIKRGYNIKKYIERIDYVLFRDILYFFSQNTDIIALRAQLICINKIKKYSMEELYVSLMNNVKIQGNYYLYYYICYPRNYTKIDLTNIQKIKQLDRIYTVTDNTIIVDKKKILLYNNYLIHKPINLYITTKGNIKILTDKGVLKFTSLFFISYYDINYNIHVADSLTVGSESNVEFKIKVPSSCYIYNYKIYHTKSDFIKIIIELGLYDTIKPIINKYNLDTLTIVDGFNILSKTKIIDTNIIRNQLTKTNITKLLHKIGLELDYNNIVYNNKYISLTNKDKSIIESYNSIIEFILNNI